MAYVRTGTNFTFGARHMSGSISIAGADAMANDAEYRLRNSWDSGRWRFRDVNVTATFDTVALRLVTAMDFSDSSHVYGIIRSALGSAGFGNLRAVDAFPDGSTQVAALVPGSWNVEASLGNPVPVTGPVATWSPSSLHPSALPPGGGGRPDIADNTLLLIVGSVAVVGILLFAFTR